MDTKGNAKGKKGGFVEFDMTETSMDLEFSFRAPSVFMREIREMAKNSPKLATLDDDKLAKRAIRSILNRFLVASNVDLGDLEKTEDIEGVNESSASPKRKDTRVIDFEEYFKGDDIFKGLSMVSEKKKKKKEDKEGGFFDGVDGDDDAVNERTEANLLLNRPSASRGFVKNIGMGFGDFASDIYEEDEDDIDLDDLFNAELRDEGKGKKGGKSAGKQGEDDDYKKTIF